MADFVITIGEIFGTKKDKKIEWFLVPELNKRCCLLGDTIFHHWQLKGGQQDIGMWNPAVITQPKAATRD